MTPSIICVCKTNMFKINQVFMFSHSTLTSIWNSVWVTADVDVNSTLVITSAVVQDLKKNLGLEAKVLVLVPTKSWVLVLMEWSWKKGFVDSTGSYYTQLNLHLKYSVSSVAVFKMSIMGLCSSYNFKTSSIFVLHWFFQLLMSVSYGKFFAFYR